MPVPQTVARYRIVRRLGAGGMGEVYLADDPALGRQVALKVLAPALTSDETARIRLIREAQAAAKLEHPNVCAVYEVGEHEGLVYFAMQYIEGETLADAIARAPLDTTRALRIAEEVADALADAHARGIIHRDIKPQNIMLSTRGPAKVLDFGLAKAVSETAGSDTETVGVLTQPGAIPGTTAYMSPEQLKGEPLDPRSDVFSFGSVLYEMVSGRRAFAQESAAGTIAAILSGAPPSLDSRLVTSELHRIIAKCLEIDRERRYQSARDLVVDLRNLTRASDPGQSRIGLNQSPRRFSSPMYWTAATIAILSVAAAGWMWSRRGAVTPTSTSTAVLAILPFASAQQSEQYLGDGISQDLINSLSQLPQLKVIARTTTLRYNSDRADIPALRRTLGVDAVVTGRVHLQNDMLVVQADLTNALDGTQIWGNRYTKRLVDIFAVQEEIARDIASNLRLRLSSRDDAGLSRRYTTDIDAYRHYLQGRSYAQRRTPADVQKSISHYEQAIALDKRYALAYTGLADAYTVLAGRGFVPIGEGRSKARDAATTALALDSGLAEAHAAVGQIHVFAAPYDFATGEAELRRAIELSPSAAIAHQYLGVALIEQGRLDEGLKSWEAARALDPLSPLIGHLVAYAYFLKRDYARALSVQRQANQLGPPFSTPQEIEIYIQNGAFGEALAEIERLTPGREADPYLRYGRAMLSAAQKPQAEGLSIARQFEQEAASNIGLAHLIARIYLIAGDHDRALAWMNRALEAGGIPVFYKDSPLWDPVRTDPRFAQLLRRMGVPASG